MTVAASGSSTSPPLIGIPASLDVLGRIRAGRDYLYLPVAYGDAILAAGGCAVLLPVQRVRPSGASPSGASPSGASSSGASEGGPSRLGTASAPSGAGSLDRAATGSATPRPHVSSDYETASQPVDAVARALVDRVDGLLLPGGDDFVPPGRTPPPPGLTPAPPEQIAFDSALLRAALRRRIPVLGVCYGMQLLALELGGSLHYDIATELAAAGPHQLDPTASHPIDVAHDSQLAQLAGDVRRVNSAHHQAVASAGAQLRAVAHAPDGVVEAVELSDHPFCVGVQWHPEQLAARGEGPGGQHLFDALVRAARRDGPVVP